jgi:bifunctional DNA-binding transcriptional regulator/antitoxin component of YhaV-PrlF toxin-antitoxin module
MEKTKVKVLSGYRVTIPEEARRRLPLSIGEELEFAIEGNRLIYKVKSLPEDPVFTMLGVAKGPQRRLGQVEEAVVNELEEKIKRSQR